MIQQRDLTFQRGSPGGERRFWEDQDQKNNNPRLDCVGNDLKVHVIPTPLANKEFIVPGKLGRVWRSHSSLWRIPPCFSFQLLPPWPGNTRRFPNLGNVSNPAFPFTFQSHLLPGILHISGSAQLGWDSAKKAGGKWENREQSSWGWWRLWDCARAESFPAGGAGMTFGNGSKSRLAQRKVEPERVQIPL